MSPAYPDFHKRPLRVQGNSFLVGYTKEDTRWMQPSLPPAAEDPACMRKDQKRSTANEGQSTTPVTRQYRGSALPPDLKKTKEPHGRRSSHHPVAWTAASNTRLMLPLVTLQLHFHAMCKPPEACLITNCLPG